MHNSVNKRLDKPRPSTVLECLNTLKNATKYTTPFEFRKKYIEYLFRDWNIHGRFTSYFFNAMIEIEKMKKTNESYWNHKEVSYSEVTFAEDDVLSFANEPPQRKLIFGKPSLKNFRWSPR
jgi:hypothetical protein